MSHGVWCNILPSGTGHANEGGVPFTSGLAASAQMTPEITHTLMQYDTFRELWRTRGSLARAAARFSRRTGDYGFAVHEMLREHHEWPIPGLWDVLREESEDSEGSMAAIRTELDHQRLEFLRRRGRPFSTIVELQEEALAALRLPRLGLPGEEHITPVAEACHKNLVLAARTLVEQAAMREALHRFGRERPADADMVSALRRASEAALLRFDAHLERGALLDEVLAVEVLLEAL